MHLLIWGDGGCLWDKEIMRITFCYGDAIGHAAEDEGARWKRMGKHPSLPVRCRAAAAAAAASSSLGMGWYFKLLIPPAVPHWSPLLYKFSTNWEASCRDISNLSGVSCRHRGMTLWARRAPTTAGQLADWHSKHAASASAGSAALQLLADSPKLAQK